MKTHTKNMIICLCIFLSSYGEFTDPFDDCFLDWNMNCLDRKNKEALESGYIYYGSDEQAKKIAENCRLKHGDSMNLINNCLLENGFKSHTN